ncbi:MAG TPA: amino acid adenylation domain-containing protein, partial [Pseudonocardia sp.]|uniref:non-ribosomal peptide synthetase n=1 Tax=Pseudonocardia sp. TaxID=60912 RepID=UPI002C340A3D
DLPFERVVDLLDPPRVLGRTPLFQTMVVYADQNPPALRLPELVDTPLSARLEAAKFDLSFTLVDDETAAPSATVRYSTALFDRSTAQRLADELRQLAEQLAADPNRPLARIEHLPPAERTRIVRTWNATEAPVSDTTLPEMFAAQVADTPDAVAAVCGETELTYRELDRWSGQLAAELLSLGVGPERTVGIHLERSLEMVVALLAVQRAGGVFVPLEPSWPRPRIQDTLATSRPVLVLSHDPGSLAWADVPALAVSPARAWAAEAPLPRLDPENLAYVMYTSGSTGQPKGAMIRQRAIANRLLWQIGLLDFGPDDAALFKAPLGFDISINEIFLPLVSGARLVICEPGLEREVDELAGLIDRQRVTFTYLPSSMLELLLGTIAATPGQLGCLRHVWCGGELLNPELYARFRAQVGATLYHGYGPAEATIGVSHEVYRPERHRRGSTIGTANPNTTIYLLDGQLRAVSTGVPGEIYLGGLPLARGYVGEPRRTAERFVADPFGGPGSRLYRTGDLARWRSDGVLEFLGRADNQIKIRGMRVELEEIESALARHPGVRQAAVRLHDGPAKRLVGYQVPDPAAAVDADALRGWLTGQLPAHMVPDSILTLAALPTLPSGKIDRGALPAPDTARTRSRAPRGEPETRLAGLFARVLGVTGNGAVGAEDDFFTLGGDSILSIQLASTARAEGLRFTVRDVFSAPTVAGLAERVSLVAAESATIPARLVDTGGTLPLSPLQRGLVFHSLADESEADAYIAQLALTFTGQLDAEALRAALAAVLGRHESLRAAFHHDGLAEPVQTIAPRLELPWRELDLTARPAAEREESWTELRHTERATRFALDRAPLLRATLVRVAEGEHRLLLTNHHLLFDGWSLPLLVTDLLAAYADGTLPPAKGQYSGYL